CVLASAWCGAAAARGQSGEPGGAGAPGAERAAEEAQKLPPQVIVGRRADVLRLNLKVRPTVVIVSTVDDYVRMIARWTLGERFPVLIDDGSARAAEDISRFVRAFDPRSVVRWSAPEDRPEGDELPDGKTNPAGFREAVETAARLAWGARNAEELSEVWKRTQFAPFGVVVASPSDPAWTAALALSAGRGQPMVWLDRAASNVGGTTTVENAAALESAIARALDEMGRPWRAVGDEIESVTLCIAHEANVAGPSGRLALTDIVGRHALGERWGWSGMIFGDAARSAYVAMCGLYLSTQSVLLFDGYKAEFAPPYAVPAAAKLYQEAGLEVSANTPPLGGLEQWRQRTRWGVDHGFIHVNSSGNNGWFDLTPGRAWASDVPHLKRPTAVHFIHSFSAQVASNVDTVAGRWLAQGAYVYYGSMDEPFLGAFHPAVTVAARSLSGGPLGVAFRQDDRPVWKLNYFGDPMVTLGPAGPRHDEPLAMERARDVAGEMREALKRQDLAAGARALLLLGRDADVVKLARATLKDSPAKATPALARAALTSAFRERDSETFVALFALLDPSEQREPLTADLLW
ncbi:MAG: hypothetical protein SFZ24_08210, partial [Planctomycetota bacterium]|nr:hypothetical protein [Planctomycetota bacterium]